MLRWMVHWSTRFNGGNWYFSWELHHRCLKFILSCKSFIQPNWEKEHALVFNKFQKLSITTNLLCVLEYIWNSTFNFLIFCWKVDEWTIYVSDNMSVYRGSIVELIFQHQSKVMWWPWKDRFISRLSENEFHEDYSIMSSKSDGRMIH